MIVQTLLVAQESLLRIVTRSATAKRMMLFAMKGLSFVLVCGHVRAFELSESGRCV